MNDLSEILRARCPLPFREFMAAALYHPEYGFYGSGRAQVGSAGDFITSVSVGPLFGRLLARQLAEMWEKLGRPAPWAIAEQGAHDGQLAADILAALQVDSPSCFSATEYILIEPSPIWRERQRAKVPAARWVDRPSDLSGLEGVALSNELLDAFPVDRVTWLDGQWREQWVEWQEDRFTFIPGPPAAGRLLETLSQIAEPLPHGYVTEVNLAARAWLRETAGALRRGWIWIIDYGYERAEYYRGERADGTLSAYARQQRVADPLERPGEIDLTTHVEFTTLLEDASTLGLTLTGFTDQQRLMAGLGQMHFTDTTEVTPARAKEQRAYLSLLHPALLGAAFKTLCLAKNAPSNLSGFQFSRPQSGPKAANSI